jgi:hypothetical protein
MSDTVHGQDVHPDPPTLDELRRAHDWRTEHRDRHEEGDRAFPVDVCEQCGYERAAARAGCPPDCDVRDVPSRLISVAKRHDLLPETGGARIESMLGVPSGATEVRE